MKRPWKLNQAYFETLIYQATLHLSYLHFSGGTGV